MVLARRRARRLKNLPMGKHEWKGNILFVILTCVTSTICASKAVYDVVRDIIKSRKQNSSHSSDQG